VVELVVTPEQAKLLAEATDSVEVVDGEGNRLDFFARLVLDRDVATASRRAATAQPGRQTAEVLDRLKKSEN
jgi:hypothetical protein